MFRVAAGKRILGSHLNKMAEQASMQATISGRPRFSGRRFILALAAALVIGLVLMATVADTLWAAIELAYYRGAATNNAVFLEWATVREVNLNGFEILCKRVNDPETTYHPIGSRIALGNTTSGATYNFDVTSGLVPGERYCFRLREITADQTPGEAFDLCGYGLGLTPPPTAVTVMVSIPVTLTPTVVTVGQVPGLDPAPTLAPTLDPFAAATPTIVPIATATPTIDPFAQGISPLATPTATITATALTQDPNGADAAQAPLTGPFPETATLTPPPTETPTVTPTLLPVEEPTATATLTTTIPVTINQSSDGIAAINSTNGLPVVPDSSVPDGSAGIAMAEATATPIYLVVTATSTPDAVAMVAPAFTPWPTAVPTASFGISNLLVPNTQNLMVGLLCLIFLSASGLGALGLVTSVLYMRSQTRRDRLPGPAYERRRY
jgi:hypothetical protein